MAEHPIQGLMTTAMDSIKEMVDVNTIVGDAVEAPDGTVVIPVSRVSFGFAAGGGEYTGEMLKDSGKGEEEGNDSKSKMPFGGGSGAGVSISPVGFLVVGQGQIRLLPVGNNSSLDRIVDMVPEIMTKLNETLRTRTVTKKKVVATENGNMVEREKYND